MRATGVITELVYRDWVTFQAKNKPQHSPEAHIEKMSTQVYWVILLFPVIFAVVGPMVFSIARVTAVIIAVIWFISFFLAGLLYHRAIVQSSTQRPPIPHLDKPRDYCIEGGWLVIRTSDTESRVSLSRAVGLTVTPTVSCLDCGDLGPFLVPFGSSSDHPDHRAFLDALQSHISKRG
jgi:hypothetical protein